MKTPPTPPPTKVAAEANDRITNTAINNQRAMSASMNNHSSRTSYPAPRLRGKPVSSRDSSTNPIRVTDADTILIGNERTENALANLINFANARAPIAQAPPMARAPNRSRTSNCGMGIIVPPNSGVVSLNDTKVKYPVALATRAGSNMRRARSSR